MCLSKVPENIKETYKYHVSLEIRTDRRFELCGISLLKKPLCEGEKLQFPSRLIQIKYGRNLCKVNVRSAN
jgi:hypothetical protein